MPIFIAAQPDTRNATVVVQVTGATRPVTITAYPEARESYVVRGTGNGTGTAPLEVVDYEAPLRQRITYTAVDALDNVASIDMPGLAVDGAVFASTFSPANSARVTVVEDQPHAWQARSAFFDVIGRRDPLVAVDVMRYRSGSLVIYCANNTERAALLNVLFPGDPVLLRTSRPDRVDDVIALVLNVDESPLVDNTGGRLFTLEYQAVTRPLGPYPGRESWTYADVALAYLTYTELLAAFPTYAALVLGPPDVAASSSSPAPWSVVL